MTPDYETLYRQYIKGVKQSASDPDQFVGFCSFHDDKKNPSFSFNTANGLCHCFTCDFKGNAYQFAKAMNDPNTSQWLTNPFPHMKKLNVTDNHALRQKAVEYSKNLSDEWKEKMIGNEKLLIGMDPIGRLTFPYFNENGEVIGIKHHKGKNGGKPYWEGEGSCKWYGMQLLKKFNRKKNLYICEGEKDCLSMLSLRHQATTGSAGAGSIPEIVDTMKDFNDYVIIYDNDLAGRKGADKLALILGKLVKGNVKIGKWGNELPVGADITDVIEYDLDELDKAIVNSEKIILPRIGYKIITMGKFQNMKDTLHKPKMVIEEIASVGGLTLLSGTDNSGKSMMSNQLALCTATGNDFLDYKICQPFQTVILSLENHDGEQRDRFEKQINHFVQQYPDSEKMIKNNLFHRIDVDEGKKFLNAWDKIFDTLKENPNIEVLIVDNLTSTSDVKLQDNDALTKLIREVEWTARKNEVAVICLCHHRKMDIKETKLHKELIRGGKSLTDFAWNVVQIHPSSIKQEWILFKITKIRHVYSNDGINTKDTPQLVVFDSESLLYDYRRAIPNESIHFIANTFDRPLKFILSLQGSNCLEQIWETKDFLNAGNQETPPVPETTIKKWLKKMVKWGWLTKIGHGIYKIKWNIVLDIPLE